MSKQLIYQDSNFRDLLVEVSADSSGKISPEFIEKDYWITRTLAQLRVAGLEIWFKGGTALAKGYGAVNRFSEDLDLKILGSHVNPLPEVESWSSKGNQAVDARKMFFRKLKEIIENVGISAAFSYEHDEWMRSANIECTYVSALSQRLAPPFKPFILLEIGSARVTPYLERTISSFVHDFLEKQNLLKEYHDERPSIRCVHPLVTLIEKLDAIARHYHRYGDGFRAEKFIRHYDDVAAITDFLTNKKLPLPLLEQGMSGKTSLNAQSLANEMLFAKDIRRIPLVTDEAFSLDSKEKRVLLERAHKDIAPMYWGARPSLKGACEKIRAWLNKELT